MVNAGYQCDWVWNHPRDCETLPGTSERAHAGWLWWEDRWCAALFRRMGPWMMENVKNEKINSAAAFPCSAFWPALHGGSRLNSFLPPWSPAQVCGTKSTRNQTLKNSGSQICGSQAHLGSHIRYPEHQIFTLQFITATNLQLWSSNKDNFMLGDQHKHEELTVLKGL